MKNSKLKISIQIFLFVLVQNVLLAQNLNFQHYVIAPDNCSQARQIGDFNNDGKGDILVIEGEFEPVKFAWYEYPDWKEHVINDDELKAFHYIADCSVADVDNDGDMDIIFPDAHEGAMRVLWFENPLPDFKPTEQWTTHIIAELGNVSWLKDIEVADFNNDGNLDAAVRGETDFYIFYQNIPLEWSSVSFPVKAHEGLASGDINRDGFIDLVSNGFWFKNPGGCPGPLKLRRNSEKRDPN